MKKISILLVMIMAAFAVNAQVAINKDGTAPDAGSILHVKGSSNASFYIQDATGEVGINTTNPVGALHIKMLGSVFNQGLHFESSTTTEDWYFYMNGSDNLNIRNDAVELVTIAKDNGNVGIGTTSPESILHVARNHSDGDADPIFHTAADVASSKSNMILRRSRGTITSPSTVQDGDVVGAYDFQAYDGSNFIWIGNMTCQVEGTVSTGVVPTKLKMFVSDASGAYIEAMTIHSTGDVNIEAEMNRTAQGNANLLPIAYGVVNSNGTISNSGTGNWTSTWNSGSSQYEITITGESFFIGDYIVTAANIGGPAMSVSYGSVSGKLLVYPKNSSGSTVQDNFSFVVYKP